MNDFIVYQSDYIVKNQRQLFDDIDQAHVNFKRLFPSNDSTWSYDKYNIFSLTAPSTAFYSLYKELCGVVRQQLGFDRPLWMQAWINYHTSDELLDWHEHAFDYHGYISIDPKNTITRFSDYTIENKIGQIYFGPGNRQHKVEAVTPFEGVRTTIGYDIHTIPSSPYIREYIERPFINMGLIPVL
jgi:hypothetical protein